MQMVTDLRVAWRLTRLITRCKRLIRHQRQLPKEDRQPFILFCDVHGHMDVEFFDDMKSYLDTFDGLADVDGWAACYDPWKDRK